MTSALVLLSGGLDSVAAMHWALATYDDVRALTFDYGQPHRNAEVPAAGTIALRRGVPWTLLHIGEAVRGTVSLRAPSPGDVGGVSRANLAARNLILLSIASAHAAREWPGATGVDIVIGCNGDDARTFPDCRPTFVAHAWAAMSSALDGVARVRPVAPWGEHTKDTVLYWAAARGGDALSDALESVSCYAGTHCGACDACTLRARAFANLRAAGIAVEDRRWLPRLCGGDPQRDAR